MEDQERLNKALSDRYDIEREFGEWSFRDRGPLADV
jgi:hypothetical protein